MKCNLNDKKKGLNEWLNYLVEYFICFIQELFGFMAESAFFNEYPEWTFQWQVF